MALAAAVQASFHRRIDVAVLQGAQLRFAARTRSVNLILTG